MVPHLYYCNIVYSDASNGLQVQLSRLSNVGIRYIFGLRYKKEHITPFRRRLNWIRYDTRTDYFASLVMYRLIHMKDPPFLLLLFTPYKTDKPSRDPRKDLKIPINITTNWGLNLFQVKYAHFWNNTPPPCIRDIHSCSHSREV